MGHVIRYIYEWINTMHSTVKRTKRDTDAKRSGILILISTLFPTLCANKAFWKLLFFYFNFFCLFFSCFPVLACWNQHSVPSESNAKKKNTNQSWRPLKLLLKKSGKISLSCFYFRSQMLSKQCIPKFIKWKRCKGSFNDLWFLTRLHLHNEMGETYFFLWHLFLANNKIAFIV